MLAFVGGSDGVRSKQGNNLGRREASVGKAGENGVHGVEWLGNGLVNSWRRRVDTAEQELELWGTRAVRDTDGACKLDEVGRVDLGVAGKERLLLVHDLVNADTPAKHVSR